MHAFVFFLSLVLGQDTTLSPTPILKQSQDQHKSLAAAVQALEKQIDELSGQAGRVRQLRTDQLNKLHEENVVALMDAMLDHVLLTRTYLALAIAEMKAVTTSSSTTALTISERDAYLRHAEAVAIAMDARILDHADLRVHRALQAGINEALRSQISAAAMNQASPLPTCQQCQTSTVVTCAQTTTSKFRLFRKRR